MHTAVFSGDAVLPDSPAMTSWHDSRERKQVPQEGGEDKPGAGRAPQAGGPGAGQAAGEVGRLPPAGLATGAVPLCLGSPQATGTLAGTRDARLSWGEHVLTRAVGPALCCQLGSPVLSAAVC